MQKANSTNIKQFVSNIVDKNYSEANKTLQQLIEDKLKERINSTLSSKNSTKLDK